MVTIVCGAASIILLHNHPTHDPEPSAENVALTQRMVRASEILDIPLHDHIVIARRGYVSLRERGKL